MSAKQKKQGKEYFFEYYNELFGTRWQKLSQALNSPPLHIKFCIEENTPYFLDAGSICAALSLPCGHKILDLCAAPGGKTLILSSIMDETSVLYANERSSERKKRLDSVINTCLPASIAKRINTSCSNGASWCRRESSCYDSILLDVPCSSERHVIQDETYLNVWTASRIKTVSMEQWALLSCACRLLKSESFLLYSTCALSPLENDLNISKALKKFSSIQVVPYEKTYDIFMNNMNKLIKYIECPKEIDLEKVFLSAEKTDYGLHILPDVSFGAGPLYFSLLYNL